MAANNYYFFTDTNLLVAQTTGAYGPIAKAALTDPDDYRVTSLHTASSNPTAYAACDAIVCVQRGPNTALVNIILKPLVQPALNFAPVRYIIYKGILASSLIDGNGTDVAASANNDLTKAIWDVQAKKNASASTPNATPPLEALGVGLTAASPTIPNDPFVDAQPIDNLFYRTGVSFQLPVVKGGWAIGQFDQTGFGMEVLMDGLAFHHPLSLARQVESTISVPALATGATDAQIFDHWNAKEQILGFMDPCAFYGSFFRAGLQAKTSSNTPFATKSGNPLYQDVLFKFANRNTAYLDIRNEHNFSLNYFKNYGTTTNATTDIKIGNTAVDYYVSKWPLLTLTASNFQNNNTTKARNSFAIQLPVGDNPKPLVYVSQGYRDINTKGTGFPAELKSAERFFADFKTAPVGGYTVTKSTSGTSSLIFAVPNVTGQTATIPVSCYTRLKYLKQQQGTAAVSTAIQSENYLSNLFYPLDLGILLDGIANIKTAVYDEEIYVNAQDETGLAFDFIGKIGIARDTCNTSFFLIPTNFRTQAEQASALVTLTGETSDYTGSYPNLIALKYPLERVRRSDLVFSPTNKVPVAAFVSDGTPAEQAKFKTPDFNKFFIITVANGAFDTWKNKVAAAQAAGFRAYLGVKNLQTPTDGVEVQYTSFELVLRVFVLDATNGKYNIQDIATDPASATANITIYAPC
jgi:hypothetical protein